MTVKDVIKRLNEIREAKDNPEDAHWMEDALWQDVLKAIAAGDCVDDPKDIARDALRSLDIEFRRWHS